MINKKLKIFVIISLIIAIVEVLMIIHIKKETKQVASEFRRSFSRNNQHRGARRIRRAGRNRRKTR